MRTMITKRLIGFAIWVGVVGTGFSNAVYFVSKDGSNEKPYGSLETAATNLSYIISLVGDLRNTPGPIAGRTILVDSGIYSFTNSYAIYNNTNLKSLNGPYETIIDYNGMSEASLAVEDGTVDGFSFVNSKNVIWGNNGTIQNCMFYDNHDITPPPFSGPGIVSYNSGIIKNCLFFNNSHNRYLISNFFNSIGERGQVINCTFWNNQIGQCVIDNGAIFNSILYNNDTMADICNFGDIQSASVYNSSISIITGREESNFENVITNDPMLEVSYETVNFQGMRTSVQIPIMSLSSNSPCIDSGLDWDGIEEDNDIMGNLRKIGKSVDMGAVEMGESDTFNFEIGVIKNGLFLHWSNFKRNSAQYYEIYRSENEDYSNAELVGTTHKTWFEDLDKNLKNRVKYYYYVVEKETGKSDKVSKGQCETATWKIDKRAKNDFSGEGKSQLTVYNKDSGEWYIKNNSSVEIISFGGNDFQPVIGDFEGNKKSTPCIYNEKTGYWYVKAENGITNSYQFGGPGYQPVAVSLTGEKNMPTVFDTNSGYWFFLDEDNTSISYLKFGNSSWIPVPKDYNGNGKDNISVYDQENGMWYIFLDNDDGSFELAYIQFGGPGYIPVPFDFNGNGISCLGLYHESSGYWFIFDGTQILSMQFGGPGYEAVTGYFDGTSKENFGVYHRNSGYWHLLDSSYNYSYQKFGQAGYIPVQ